MTTWTIVAWCVVLVGSLVGLVLKDVRLHGLALLVSLVMLVLALVGHRP